MHRKPCHDLRNFCAVADPRKKQVTTLLRAGDRGAADRLLALVYDEQYALAKARMA
jgi:hypothetical protein